MSALEGLSKPACLAHEARLRACAGKSDHSPFRHGGRIRKFRLEVGRRVAKGTHVIFFHRGEPASAARSLTMRTKATR
jgi:hypothetical protein